MYAGQGLLSPPALSLTLNFPITNILWIFSSYCFSIWLWLPPGPLQHNRRPASMLSFPCFWGQWAYHVYKGVPTNVMIFKFPCVAGCFLNGVLFTRTQMGGLILYSLQGCSIWTYSYKNLKQVKIRCGVGLVVSPLPVLYGTKCSWENTVAGEGVLFQVKRSAA